ncbi:MAG: hypothetical protein RMK32_04830 [Anaerolineae bacterium]|nr:hypothetical protein [Thermoflexus sp.]MDW8064936.1 hypothetical protein [Anaerolineae bacterium]
MGPQPWWVFGYGRGETFWGPTRAARPSSVAMPLSRVRTPIRGLPAMGADRRKAPITGPGAARTGGRTPERDLREAPDDRIRGPARGERVLPSPAAAEHPSALVFLARPSGACCEARGRGMAGGVASGRVDAGLGRIKFLGNVSKDSTPLDLTDCSNEVGGLRIGRKDEEDWTSG